MKRALVVGSGAGGATVAKELQGAFDVTVLEAGGPFEPSRMSLKGLERLKRAGLLVDPREIALVWRNLDVRMSTGGMVLVRGVGLGGSTTVSTGSALRRDEDLRAIGIDLDREFEQVYRDIPIGTTHRSSWRPTTRALFEACEALGLEPRPTPKLGDAGRCRRCGRCVFGCPWGAKWDARALLDEARARGAEIVSGSRVECLALENGRAVGVVAREGWRRVVRRADLVVLAAGGLGTPAILERSGIPCEATLSVDPLLCVAAHAPDARQCYEIPMPFTVQRDGYLLAPYFDVVSFGFGRAWRHPAKDILAIMIKLADSNRGRVGAHRVDKSLTSADRRRFDEAGALAKRILAQYGVEPGSTFLGVVNGGHPAGALPLTERESDTLHHARLPANVYVADATLLPRSLGSPAILTVIALAKRVARACAERLA
jgi:choline dehydrogenase-like flavoprotein